MTFTLKSVSEVETREMGRRLGEIVPAGTVIALNGELGAGKTVFAQGLGLGLGVEEQVTSPSFVLMNIYHGRLEFYHFDFYRLDEEEELAVLALDEYFYGDGVVLVEWASKFPRVLPPDRMEIRIARNEAGNDEERLLQVSYTDNRNEALLKEWSRQCCF